MSSGLMAWKCLRASWLGHNHYCKHQYYPNQYQIPSEPNGSGLSKGPMTKAPMPVIAEPTISSYHTPSPVRISHYPPFDSSVLAEVACVEQSYTLALDV
jgi:hypothetical protein